MNWDDIKSKSRILLRKWWLSLLLIPFVIYSVHQSYWTLQYNIFFAINYEFPFPINFVHFILDNFLLIVHEAGHTFFGLPGIQIVTILGGSLFQIILPLLILGYFWFNNRKAGLQLSWYLLGFSFMDVAYYAADGSGRLLPLIGGLSKDSHDWYNILSRWNMLDSDLTIGILFTVLGIFCYLAALATPLFLDRHARVHLNLDLSE